MKRLIRPRLRAPAQVAVIGLAGAAAIVAGYGWGNAIPFAVLAVALAIGVYVWGGRDTDRGALIGSRPDERQASLQMKVTALQGKVMTLAAAVAYLVAIAVRARSLWPFALFVIIGGVSGLIGWVIYRDDGPGQVDDADAGHEEPSPVSR
jgi:hypothetical protein